MTNQDTLNEAEQKVFAEEQAHLTKTYDYIKKREADVARQQQELNEKASSVKLDIAEDMGMGFADQEESFESNLELESVNQVVDMYNIDAESLNAQDKDLKKLLESPYFARVRLKFPDEEESEDYYIGTAGLNDQHYIPVIIDWRSPVAETYYNQSNGKTFYEVDGRKIEVELLMRRQYDITGNKLNACFDTSLAIEDPLLLKALSHQRSDKMSAITATIQKEQNTVIRYPDVSAMLVVGIAGSGKTSVLLQRIAYLMFRKRKTLHPENVILMTLNPVFENYISEVLPDLGEENPTTMTWSDFSKMFGERGGRLTDDSDAKSCDIMDEKLETLELSEEDFTSIRQNGQKILSAQRIYHIYKRNQKLGLGERLVNVMMDQLTDEVKLRALTRKKSKREKQKQDDEALYGMDERGNALSAEELNDVQNFEEDEDKSVDGVKDRKEALQKLESLSKNDENRIMNDFGGAIRKIRTLAWLKVDRIGQRLLGKNYLTEGERIYLKLLLTGARNRHAQYVMIDEVQDYTETQIRILRRYFHNARFLMLGDEFQAIRPGTISFDRLKELFASKKMVTLSLMTSYRSSPEITNLFASLLPKKEQMKVASVQREGVRPVIQVSANREDYVACLKHAVKVAKDREELTAIVANSGNEVDRLRSLLGDDAPKTIRTNDELPKNGVFMIVLGLAKGLEFDSVIIPDADSRTYPDTVLKRHQLYTAVSRATNRVTLLAEKELTPLIKEEH